MANTLTTLLWLVMLVWQVFAIISCFQKEPKTWMRIFWGICSILMLIAVFNIINN